MYIIIFMRSTTWLESIIIGCLLVATIGTGYIFFVSIILRRDTYSGFYNSWQFPMLLAIFIDTAFYKHVNKLS